MPSRLLVGVSLVVLALASPLAAASTTVALPRWQVGDEWTYAIQLVDGGQLVQTGERHVVVTARGPYSYGGGTREAVTLTTWHNMTGDPAASWSDVRDAATGALLATQSGGQPLVAAAPCEDVRYPLSYPMGWTESCDLGSGAVETHHSVVGGETLTLPAGTFDALTVDSVGNDAVRRWYAQEACGKVAEFSQVNEQQTYLNLTRVRCAPAASGTTTTTTTTTRPTGSATTTTTTTTARPTGTAAGMPFPNFTRGDRWVYDAKLTAGGKTYDVESTIQANDIEDVELGGGGTVKARLMLRDDMVRPPGGGDSSSLSAIRSHLHLTATGEVAREKQQSPTRPVDGLVAPNMTIAYDAPCAQVKWPLVPGARWDVRCPAHATVEGAAFTLEVTGTGRVGDVRTQQVGAGTFEVYPVTLDLRYGPLFTRTQTILFSEDACWFVHAKPGTLTTEDTLREFSCRASGQGEGARGSETPGPGAALAVAALVVAGAALARTKRS